MLISCNGYKDNRENCGHKKDDWYNKNMISPMEDDCETHFEYTINGEMLANAQSIRGLETIEHLDLNSSLLKRARRSAIYMSGLFDADFDENKKEELLEFYNVPQEDGLIPFCPAILYCIKNADTTT